MAIFDNQDVYNKHQSDCDCGEDSCGCNDDCGCCPPGLVAVKDCNGEVSCLTPNDAACLTVNSHIPAEGYVKLYHPTTNVYIGDVTPDEWITIMAAIDPSIIPIGQGDEYNITTQDSVALTAPPDTETRSTAVPFKVDRISCEDAIVVTLVTPPAGVSFIGGAASLTILAGESEIIDGIEITDVIDAGDYDVTIQYDGCNNAKTEIITLNVT